MKLIFYEKNGNDVADKLIGMMRPPIEENKIQIYRTINELSLELSQLSKVSFIIVMIPKDREDLVNIQGLQESLRDIRSIVILPDGEDETIKLGHQLEPRFLTFIDANLSEVSRVLRKMLELSGLWFG